MKLLIVNNLSSGFGEGAIYDFVRSFVSDGDEVCIRSTDGTTDLTDMLEDASSYDAVVASGGDGTVAAVCYELRNTGIPILPFPAGTANILTLNLASPLEPHALAKLVKSGQTLDFDLGEIEVAGKTFGFAIMAGAGYDAAIMHDAKPNKRLLGPMAYFSAAITNPLPEVSRFTLTIDGETIEREGLGILLVNFSKIQFDISVTHENGGDFPDRSDALEIHRGSKIEVSADPPMQVQYDGEATELTTPFSAHILKGATKLFISDEGYDLFS